MNSIEDQSSGDSSHLYSNYHIISINTEGLPIFHPEPGTSLANAIGEQMPSMNLNETIQPISSILSRTESNNDSDRQSLNESENLKYKTELCRNFSIYGLCSYSSRCQFAHGLEELRCRTRHPKYKTELCRNFLSGHCKYGSRCQFLHNSDESKNIVQSNDNSDTSSIEAYHTAVAAIGTYLLTNMLAQSAAFDSGGSMTHQFTPAESFLRRTTIPLNCGIEMQQIPHLHLSPNIFRAMSIPQNQNNNDLKSTATNCHTNQTLNISSEDIPSQKFDNNTKRIRKSSAHI